MTGRLGAEGEQGKGRDCISSENVEKVGAEEQRHQITKSSGLKFPTIAHGLPQDQILSPNTAEDIVQCNVLWFYLLPL